MKGDAPTIGVERRGVTTSGFGICCECFDTQDLVVFPGWRETQKKKIGHSIMEGDAPTVQGVAISNGWCSVVISCECAEHHE